MHIDECKDGNLVFCSINWDYCLNPSYRYSKLVLIDSSCNLIKELKIEYPLFNSKIFRIFSLDSGYITLGALSLKSKPNQSQIQILSLKFKFEITKEYIINLPANIEPYWFMGTTLEKDGIVASVNLSKYPAPITGSIWLNLFIHLDWNQNFINYKFYQPGISSSMADGIDKDKISEGFIGSGSVNLKIDKNLNVIDSIESPWFFKQCGPTSLFGANWSNSLYFAVTGCQSDTQSVELYKLDSKFNIQNRARIYNGIKETCYWGESMDGLINNRIYLGGMSNINNFVEPSTFYLFAMDSSFKISWKRFFGGDAFYRLLSLKSTKSGFCYIGGEVSTQKTKNESNPFIIKLDQNGKLICSTFYKPGKTWDINVFQDYNNKLIVVCNIAVSPCQIILFSNSGCYLGTYQLQANGTNQISLAGFPSGLIYYGITANQKNFCSGSIETIN